MKRPDLESLQTTARRDDWHRLLVGSDVRSVIAYALQVEQERDEWKRRAAAHGCDTEKGDPDCG